MYIWNITVILFTFVPSGPAGPASPSKPGSPCIKQTKTHPWQLEYCFCTFINIKPMFHRLNTHPCSDKSSCPSVPRRPEWPLCKQWKDIIRVQKHRLFYSFQQVYVLFYLITRVQSAKQQLCPVTCDCAGSAAKLRLTLSNFNNSNIVIRFLFRLWLWHMLRYSLQQLNRALKCQRKADLATAI